ncbi:hypothetical protein [Singulisphaera sp. PoT]|uniref:hypothetical protein n=1 Tax=Singulisphaera sp. PoT TaxID=3411797 RepID=UPI003BF49406
MTDRETSELEAEDEAVDEVSDAGDAQPSKHVMTAAEALEKIQRGEVIEGVRIERLRLRGAFAKPVQFRRVTLAGFSIEGANFADLVSFEACTLDRPQISKKSFFTKDLRFMGSTIIKPQFRNFKVHGTCRLDSVRARGKFLVQNAEIATIRLWDAVFNGWVEFKQCEFLGSADFRSFHVEEGFILTQCKFRDDLLFRGTVVQKKWQADRTRFDGLVDLSKAKLHDYVYLEDIEQGEKQRFAFANMVAERILIRPDQVEGRLASEISGDYSQAMYEYAFLKRVFEGLHRYDQEDWAFYRFKVNQRLSRQRSWKRPWSKCSHFGDWLFLDHGCGYGTNPGRAIRAAVVIMFAFALIYMAGIDSFIVDPDNMPFEGPKHTFANRTMIATLTSVSAFISGFGDMRLAAKGWMNVPLIIESILGTLLWGLFIVAFSRKVIR